MIRERQPRKLEYWLGKVDSSQIAIWHNFATSLKQDYEAELAVLIYDFLNGSTEDHINRLKFLKRMMSGRARDDL